MRKRFLFIVSHTPGCAAADIEAIDAILVAAAFDQDVGVLFTGDGVLHLAERQGEWPSSERDPAKAPLALPTYDVTRVYADTTSLSTRGLTLEDLMLKPTPVDTSAVAQLFAGHDVVLPT